MTVTGWIMLSLVLALLWGVAGWSLVRTMGEEGRKARLLHRHGSVDRLSPRALADLEAWLAEHPEDPYADLARERVAETRDHRASGRPCFYDG